LKNPVSARSEVPFQEPRDRETTGSVDGRTVHARSRLGSVSDRQSSRHARIDKNHKKIKWTEKIASPADAPLAVTTSDQASPVTHIRDWRFTSRGLRCACGHLRTLRLCLCPHLGRSAGASLPLPMDSWLAAHAGGCRRGLYP
jgi:hypothetical protein